MSKLFKIKEWLTLADAARHLSIVFNEDVTQQDILRLAIDRRLRLSVWFVNHVNVRKGRLVPLKDCPLRLLPKPFSKSKKEWPNIPNHLKLEDIPALTSDIRIGIQKGDLMLIPEGLHYKNQNFLILDEDVESITGVWDLPMVGGESLDVEHEYQMITGGPAVTGTYLDGAFVERDGVICQLQECFDDNEYQPGSKADLKHIKAHIAENGIESEQAKKLHEEYAVRRKAFLEKVKAAPASNNYYPAAGLPEDVIYVVRTTAIRDLERIVLDEPEPSTKPLAPREETTYLNIIGGLLYLLRGKTPSGKSHSVLESEAAIINALLVEHTGKPGIAERTLQDKFAAAKRSLKS
jgi:hypothetical protein